MGSRRLWWRVPGPGKGQMGGEGVQDGTGKGIGQKPRGSYEVKGKFGKKKREVRS